MKKTIFILFTIITVKATQSDPLHVAVATPRNYEKMRFLIACVGSASNKLPSIAEAIKNDFYMSGQFEAEIRYNISLPATIKDVKIWWEQNPAKRYPFVLFLTIHPAGIEYRLYDTSQAIMLVGKKITLSGEISFAWVGHQVSDTIWPLLTGQQSSFATVIAACKTIKKNNKKYQYLYIFCPSDAYATEFKPKALVTDPTLTFAPRWHPLKSLLYCSQHTLKNVRLISVDYEAKKRIVTNFDGLNMMPTISLQGNIVLSLTQHGYGRLCRYYQTNNGKWVFEAITNSSMHAISPSFIDERQIVFCAIENHLPSISLLDLPTRKITRISQGFCVAPTFSAKKDVIAYCKKIQGMVQIFLYDLKSKRHNQLTFTKGDKDECSWSSCGNYLIYSVDFGRETRLALFNMLTHEEQIITPSEEYWNFPSWSPTYREMPFEKLLYET